MQLEVGDASTAFEHEDIGTTLRKCYRYYYQVGGAVAYEGVMTATWYTTTALAGTYYFPVDMRAAPSVSKTGDLLFLVLEALLGLALVVEGKPALKIYS